MARVLNGFDEYKFGREANLSNHDGKIFKQSDLNQSLVTMDFEQGKDPAKKQNNQLNCSKLKLQGQ